ncbi:hypothetical protein BDF19DRAFT_429029 [Syncephalis fuscata]|nr:hypothetical protein BDF19DRAFT_429029 [Syncephalis fuscata]
MHSTLLFSSAAAVVILQVLSATAIYVPPNPTTSNYKPVSKLPKGKIAFTKIEQGSNNLWFGDKAEGAAVDKEGNIYAVDMTASGTDAKRLLNNVGRLDSSNKASIFYTDSDTTTYVNGVGAKGGRVLLADVTNHRVIEVKANIGGNSERRILCKNDKMLQPNDLAVAPNGKHVYLTGMKGDNTSGSGDLWLCDEKGVATLLDTMGRTNGIEVCPLGDYLYVTEAVGGWTPTAGYIWRYTLNKTTGKPEGKKELFFDFQKYDQSGSTDSDGMRIDSAHNLYVTRNGGKKVVKISKDGKGQTIETPFEKVTNLEMGGKDGKTLYVVGSCSSSKGDGTTGCVAKASVPIAGRAWKELQ